MEKIQTVKIQDQDYGDTYTVHIQRIGDRWIGWVQEHPKVRCEEHTKKALLETLQNTLYETLEANWKAWDKQIEEDAKAGRLDRFAEKALENFRAGKYYEIEELQKLLEK